MCQASDCGMELICIEQICCCVPATIQCLEHICKAETIIEEDKYAWNCIFVDEERVSLQVVGLAYRLNSGDGSVELLMYS